MHEGGKVDGPAVYFTTWGAEGSRDRRPNSG